jgi:hypothetical protein
MKGGMREIMESWRGLGSVWLIFRKKRGRSNGGMAGSGGRSMAGLLIITVAIVTDKEQTEQIKTQALT